MLVDNLVEVFDIAYFTFISDACRDSIVKDCPVLKCSYDGRAIARNDDICRKEIS